MDPENHQGSIKRLEILGPSSDNKKMCFLQTGRLDPELRAGVIFKSQNSVKYYLILLFAVFKSDEFCSLKFIAALLDWVK